MSLNEWRLFADEMKTSWGVSVDCLTEDYKKEHYHYHLQTCQWSEVAAGQIVSDPVKIKVFDCNTVCRADVEGVLAAPFDFELPEARTVNGFVGWFDVHFRGSDENPAVVPVTLSTAPEIGYTHWGQQVMVIDPPHLCSRGDRITGTIDVTRQGVNQRLLNIGVAHKHVEGGTEDNVNPPKLSVYSLD